MIAALALLLLSPPAGPDILPELRLRVRLESAVSTETAKAGDAVEMRTTDAVVLDGHAIPAGSRAHGVVGKSQRPGRIRGRGLLEIDIVSIALPDGTTMPLSGSSGAIEPRRPSPRVGVTPRPGPTPSILAGVAAGYGTALLVSRVSKSEDTIATSGLIAGAATAVLVNVLKRGEDLVLQVGATIDLAIASQHSDRER